MELHEHIYQLRKQKNMTQQELADLLGVSRQAVSRWEMGTAKPEVDCLTAMSRIFGITVDALLTGEQVTAEDPTALEDSRAAEEKSKPNPRKWIIAWAVAWLAVVVFFMVLTFVRWKFGGALVSIAPVTLILQSINFGFDLGVVFVIAYFIRKAWKK